MTITEAAACGTPAVATRIAGHADAVRDGAPGCSSTTAPPSPPRSIACSPTTQLRDRLGAAALARARRAHVGCDGARHVRGARQPRRCGASRRERRRPSDARSRRGAHRVAALRTALGYVGLALLAYVPVFRSSPGQGRGRHEAVPVPRPDAPARRGRRRCGIRTSGWAPSPTRTSATCSRWARTTGSCDRLGVPDWVAQRLWLGSLLFAAGVGVLYLLRTFGLRGPGVVVAALAYMLTPYTLDYAARISVLLMPWAALPWMIGLMRKALRDGGWRYPAIFALVVQVVGGVNATALAVRRASARRCGSSTRGWSHARCSGDARSASRRRPACSRSRRRCGGSPGSRSRAATGSTS